MEINRSNSSYKRSGKAPTVNCIPAYKKANSPSKHNTIYGCKDESFLKEIYSIERNAEWRRMCVHRIYDQDYLENVAKSDPCERVRKQAAKNSKRLSLILWLKDNDPSPLVREYASWRYLRLPESVKFIID